MPTTSSKRRRIASSRGGCTDTVHDGATGTANTTEESNRRIGCPDIKFIDKVHDCVRRRLIGIQPPARPCGYAAEFDELSSLVNASVCHGESNSALVIGSRGSGKSLLVERAIERATASEAAASRGCCVVRLNGLVYHDDGSALREIARQVHVDIPEEDGDGHPEHDLDGDGAVSLERGAAFGGSTTEIANTLIAALKAGSKEQSQCLLIVLDEFDLFAHTGKQSLLYTLFDTAQAGLTPLCVIGITSRYDVEDLLEKRVLSRFSRRKFYLHSGISIDSYTQVLVDFLSYDEEEEGFSQGDVECWNSAVQQFANDQSVRRQVQLLYDTNRSFRALQRLGMYVVLQLNGHALSGSTPQNPFPTHGNLFKGVVQQKKDSKTTMILSLSILELSLIIAMSNVIVDQDRESCNFEITYEAYRKFLLTANASGGGESYSKPVAFKAFEHLADLELVRFVDGSATSNGNTPKGYRGVHLMVEPAQIDEALKRYPSLPTYMRSWLRQR